MIEAPVRIDSNSPMQVAPPSKHVPRPETMVRLEGIGKTYAGQQSPSVADLDLDIREGEIFGLLGPSGCGKTTTLRMVAGLEDPDRGSIWFRDKPIVVASRRFFLAPEKRHVGMVFQSYAIWPHMTVGENIAYPLKVRGRAAAEIGERVGRVLELVGMSRMADRPAMQLSGGQQQRVALARALVYEPGLLLLDEPFSNLDTNLREQMRHEIKMLQAKLGITVLFVTHDQVEALSLSSRLAVLNQGRVQQVGTPRELYEHPANEFVRDFLGRAVVFHGFVEAVTHATVTVRLLCGRCELVLAARDFKSVVAAGDELRLSIRPEDLEINSLSARGNESMFVGRVATALFTGERVEYRLDVEGQGVVSVFGSRHGEVHEGESVNLCVPPGESGLWQVLAASN